jgi:hypothetical protein
MESHFYEMLSEDNPSFESYTYKRGKNPINVFDKEIIIIPINVHYHWSLCVVVNPGKIANAYKHPPDDTDIWPGIYLFDSRNTDSCPDVARNVRRWLNGEYKRLRANPTNALLNDVEALLSEISSCDQTDEWLPFSDKAMVVATPEGTQLDDFCRFGKNVPQLCWLTRCDSSSAEERIRLRCLRLSLCLRDARSLATSEDHVSKQVAGDNRKCGVSL